MLLRLVRLPGGGLVWLLALALSGLARAADDDVALLEGLNAATAAAGVTIRLDLSAPRTPKKLVMEGPDRVVYDFPGTRVSSGSLEWPLGHRLCQRVRIGQFSESPPVARVVLDLPSPQTVSEAWSDDHRTLFLGLGAGAGRPQRGPPPEPRLDVVGAQWTRQEAADCILSLRLSAATRARAFYLTAPDRLVVDVEESRLRGDVPAPSRENGVVGSVRASQFASNLVRLVFELRRPAGHLVYPSADGQRLDVRLTCGETKGRLVVVDAGHGGKDQGTSGYRPGLFEDEVNLDVTRRVKALLEQKGLRVALTREDDRYVELYSRPAFANALRADLFVSLHCNAMPAEKRGQRSGTELYWHNEQSRAFAEIMLREVARQIGLEARGTFQRRFVVVKETRMPAVLVELGYLDSPRDGALLETPEFRQRCAVGVANGAIAQLQRLPPAPVADAPAERSGKEAS